MKHVTGAVSTIGSSAPTSSVSSSVVPSRAARGGRGGAAPALRKKGRVAAGGGGEVEGVGNSRRSVAGKHDDDAASGYAESFKAASGGLGRAGGDRRGTSPLRSPLGGCARRKGRFV